MYFHEQDLRNRSDCETEALNRYRSIYPINFISTNYNHTNTFTNKEGSCYGDFDIHSPRP